MPSPFDATAFDDPGALGPLDVSNLAPTPAALPTPQGPPKGADRQKWMKLVAIVGAAAKGGPGAIEGLMAGFQQAEQQKQQQMQQQAQTERQSMLDQRAGQAQQFSQQQQVAQLQQRQQESAAKQEADRGALLADFTKALLSEDLTDPAAVELITNAYEAQGRAIGMRPGAFRTAAEQAIQPAKLKQRTITKRWNAMSVAEKQIAQQARASLQIGGEVVPFDEWGPVVGGMVDPKTGAYPQAAPKPDTATPGSFEEYVSLPPDQQKLREQQRKAFLQSDDRAQPQATVLIQTVDENGTPVQRFVPRQAGAQFSVAPTAGQQTALAEQEAGIQLIGEIDRLYRPELVGPVVGRLTRAQMAIPGAPDVPQETAEFYASVDAVRNEIIRLMSGAAVSGAEEQRMRAQLPDVLQKPSVFQARLSQTRKNREALLARMQARSGGMASPSSGAPASAPKAPAVQVGKEYNHPQYGRVKVTGVNPDGTIKVEKVVK